MKPILKSERKKLILEEIKSKQFLHLEEIVTLLETSESTVRRDLDELEEEGVLRRVHGGAEYLSHLQSEETIQEKSIKNVQEKQAIGQKASSLVRDQDVIFIDAGTTTDLMLSFLNQENITVVTNSIHHAATLVDKNIRTLMIGGMVKNATDATVGFDSVRQIENLHFDKAFLGMNGIDNHHLTTPDLEEAAVKRAVINQAKKSFVLLDATKIGQVSFAKVEDIQSVTLITNQNSNPLLAEIKKQTEVIEV